MLGHAIKVKSLSNQNKIDRLSIFIYSQHGFTIYLFIYFYTLQNPNRSDLSCQVTHENTWLGKTPTFPVILRNIKEQLFKNIFLFPKTWNVWNAELKIPESTLLFAENKKGIISKNAPYCKEATFFARSHTMKQTSGKVHVSQMVRSAFRFSEHCPFLLASCISYAVLHCIDHSWELTRLRCVN